MADPLALAYLVRDTFGPVIDGGHFPKRANRVNALMTALRPYLEEAVNGAAPLPNARRAPSPDQRTRPWLLSMEFWRGNEKVAESDGRRTDNTGLIVAHGGNVVKGLDEGAQLIADFARDLGAPEEQFAFGVMRKTLGYLRATISRQQGHATMRHRRPDTDWVLICDVFREDAFPKE